jgi:hypothetical protein
MDDLRDGLIQDWSFYAAEIYAVRAVVRKG